MDQVESHEPSAEEPFLLYASSVAYLDGDARDIRRRFQFRRDVLDYLAMAGVVAGALLLLVNLMQLARGGERGEDRSAAASATALAGVLIVAGAYYVVGRHGAAAARERMIREGKVLPGTVVACAARDELSAEAALGEVTRAYRVTLEYRFTTPEGATIEAQDEHDRPDLRRAELPPPGTPVRVLYLDDQTYAVL